MEGFLQRRATDPRFQNERRVAAGGGTWYYGDAAARTSVTTHTFSAANASSGGYGASPKMSEKKSDGSPRKSRKLKRKKGSDEFTEAQKKELRNRDSSDGSDSGGCWSGYESVDGVAKGKKGSCKKKKTSD
jgi:hypothetical protein